MTDLEADQHLDPTSEINLETIKERAVKGVVALSGRYLILFGISFVAQGFLGAFLSPAEWGVFAIVSAVVNFLVYFSDVGLAAALIQNKEKITDLDLKSTFTVQQILVVSLLVILFVASPFIRSFYHLSGAGLYLLYALAGSFFMSSLKTIPSVLLERELRFEKLALAGILENLAYNAVLVVLAWQNFGIMSFTWAVLVRGIVGLVTLYALRPWRPGYALSKGSLKKLLSFGVPYQINTFIAVLKDDGLVIVLGKILGLDSMGLLLWAQKWAQMPLRLFMDHVTKVTFPAFARMQDTPGHLAKSVTKSLFFITFLVFPTLVGLIIVAPFLVQIIPRYSKWTPALIPLAILGINVIFASMSTQLTNLLNSIGKIKTTFKLMVMWATLTWILVPFLASRFGIVGAAAGYALVGSSSVVAIYVVRRKVEFSLWEGVGKTGISVAIMGAVLLFARGFLPVSIVSILIMAAVGALLYLSSIYLLVGPELVSDVKKIAKGFRSK